MKEYENMNEYRDISASDENSLEGPVLTQLTLHVIF